MNIKLELLSKHIAEIITRRLNMMNIIIDADEIADTTAIKALSEIQEVIQDEELSDFDAIEKIVCIFENYKIRAGSRHDF